MLFPIKRSAAALLITLFTISGSLHAQEKTRTDSLVFTKFYSAILGEERKIVVHLPLNYFQDTKKKYPVMYVLDAGRLDFDISDRLFALSSAGLSPAGIVVGILNNKGTRERDLTPPFLPTATDDSASPYGKADQFLKFMQQELIPKMDSNYRTSRYQTISGHSRAGLFVLYTLLEQPGLFHSRFCYSTPAWRSDNLLIHRIGESLRKPFREKSSYLFYSVGENENPNILSAFHNLNTLLKKDRPENLRWESFLTPYGDHQTNPALSIARALRYWAEFVKDKKIMVD
jgi:predicted alpha/beta superfamily hydrolase